MLVLGIDHGTKISGWGLLNVSLDKNKELTFSHVAHGLVYRPKGMDYPYSMSYMVRALRDKLAEVHPDYVALEAPKDNRGFKATQVLTELLGSIKTMCMEAGYGFSEIPPSTMKKLVTGYGWSDKEEVARAAAVKLGLKFEDIVGVEYYKSGAKEGKVKRLLLDGTDALGLAMALVPYTKNNGGLDYNPKRG